MGSDLFAGSYNNVVFKSVDNGVNWTRVNTGLTLNQNFIWSFEVVGTTIYAATSYGVFSSSDGGANWVPKNTGLLIQDVISVDVYGSIMYAITSGGGVYTSTDSGATWNVSNNGLQRANINHISKQGTTFFAGTKGAGLFRSTDNAATWTTANTGLVYGEVLAVEQVDDKFLLASTDGIYSSDDGLSWTIT